MIVTREGPLPPAPSLPLSHAHLPVVWLEMAPARDLAAATSPHAVPADEVVLVRFPSDVRASSTSSGNNAVGGSGSGSGSPPLVRASWWAEEWSVAAYVVVTLWNVREIVLHLRGCFPGCRRRFGLLPARPPPG